MRIAILFLDLFPRIRHKGAQFIGSLVKVFAQMFNTRFRRVRRIIGYPARTASIGAITGLILFAGSAGQAVAHETLVAALSSTHATQASIRAASSFRTSRAQQGLKLEALADRLRATDAIGVIKKLAIKSKVNDLARRFGYYHDGHRMADLKELRGRFESLRANIVTALKPGDPALAKDVARSGQSLWLAFRDPILFAEGVGRELAERKAMTTDDIGQ
jgi:hypothetical protein